MILLLLLIAAHLRSALFGIWSVPETFSHFPPRSRGRGRFISLYLRDSLLLYLNHPPRMDDLSDTQSCPHFLFFCPVCPLGTCHYRWSIFSPCKSPSTTVARPSRAPADVWTAVWACVRVCVCVCLSGGEKERQMLAVWSRTRRSALRSLVLIQLRGTEDVKGHLITHINRTLLNCQTLFQFFFLLLLLLENIKWIRL